VPIATDDTVWTMRWLLAVTFACGSAGAPAPVTTTVAQPVEVPAATGDTYTGELGLHAVLADLIGLGKPTAVQLRARYASRATTMEFAGPNLSHPDWVVLVNGEHDVFFTLGGDVIGLQLWEDHGAYVELAVAKGTLAEAQTVIGPTQALPDENGHPRVAANVGATQVFVELASGGTDVKRVMVHFEP